MELVDQEFENITKLLLGDELSRKFCDYFVRRNDSNINWHFVDPLKKEDFLLNYDTLPTAPKEKLVEYLKKIAILKLNGGLGTSMGLNGPKSIIVVKDEKCFLELIFDQLIYLNSEYNVNVPLILMNSYATEVETKKVVSKFPQLDIRCFNQNRFPRLRQDTFIPLAKTPEDPDSCWAPPGHGEVYDCLYRSEILDKLIAEDKEYIFLANVDNLGSTIDMRILTRLFSLPPQEQRDVISEQTLKVPADVKGGMVIRYNYGGDKINQKFRLLETAMVPADHMHEFSSMEFFQTFNCNNIWVRLNFLKSKIESNQLKFDVFQNFKTVNSVPIIQLESAMGSIVHCAETARTDVLLVPRIRFIPTKKCSDLVFIRSNYYTAEHGCLRLNAASIVREPSLPTVLFAGPFLERVEGTFARVPWTLDTRALVRLEVDGDVSFGKGVVLRGTVFVKATEGKLAIPDNTELEDVEVTDGMRISPLVK